MAVDLRSCEQDAGAKALKKGVEVLLSGVDGTREGILPPAKTAEDHSEQWKRFLERELESIKRAVFASYQGALAMRLEDVLAASQTCIAAARDLGRTAEASHLAREVLSSTRGARHERLLARLENLWREGSQSGHPAVSVAVKAAVFHEPLPAAQAAYFFQEWRASGAPFLKAGHCYLEKFLESQPGDLVAIAAFWNTNDLQSSLSTS